MGCALAPPDEYNWAVHVRPCGLLSNYFDHVFVFILVFSAYFYVVLSFGLLVNACFVCDRFSLFSTMPSDCLGRTSLQWSAWCIKTVAQSLHWLLQARCVVLCQAIWCALRVVSSKYRLIRCVACLLPSTLLQRRGLHQQRTLLLPLLAFDYFVKITPVFRLMLSVRCDYHCHFCGRILLSLQCVSVLSDHLFVIRVIQEVWVDFCKISGP